MIEIQQAKWLMKGIYRHLKKAVWSAATRRKPAINFVGVAFFLGLSSHHAISAEWVLVGADSQSRVFVDAQSIASEVILNDKYMKAWFRREYVTPQTIEHKRYRAVVTLNYFKCDERASANLQATYYDEPMENGIVFHTEGSYLGTVVFEEVKPGSLGEALLKAACVKRH